MSKWKLVFKSQKLHEASIVEGVLRENGLKAVQITKQDPNYLIGYIEVYVPPQEALIALNLIENEIKF